MDPNLPEQDNDGNANDEYISAPNTPEPVVIAPLHFILLSLATLGLYAVWWQYKCWKYFKEREGSDTIPVARAIFFLFFGIELFSRIAIYCKEYNHRVSYQPVAIWAMCVVLNLVSCLPVPYMWVSLLGFVPFLLPVREFNFYFTGNKNGYIEDKLNDRQILLLVLGGIFWLLIMASLIMGDPSAIKH